MNEQKEISSAFRKLARKHHPDLNAGNKDSEARFKELSEAYAGQLRELWCQVREPCFPLSVAAIGHQTGRRVERAG